MIDENTTDEIQVKFVPADEEKQP